MLQNQTEERIKKQQIAEDVLEESGGESQSDDVEKIKRDKRYGKMQAEWQRQKSHVLTMSHSRRFNSTDNRTLIDRQSEFKARPETLTLLYESNDSFLRAATAKPTIHLQSLENKKLNEINSIERSRFSSQGARVNFLQSLHNSFELFNETTTDITRKLWAVVKRRPPTNQDAMRMSMQSKVMTSIDYNRSSLADNDELVSKPWTADLSTRRPRLSTRLLKHDSQIDHHSDLAMCFKSKVPSSFLNEKTKHRYYRGQFCDSLEKRKLLV